MHHPTDRIIHTTAFVTPVVEHWLERECFIGLLFEAVIRHIKSTLIVLFGMESVDIIGVFISIEIVCLVL